jgi:hypothetical protein
MKLPMTTVKTEKNLSILDTEKIIELLKTTNNSHHNDAYLKNAILVNQIDIVKTIVKNSYFNYFNIVENIFFTISCGYLDIIIFLVEYYSIDKKIINDYGNTFLKSACYYYNVEYSAKEAELQKRIEVVKYFSQ